MATDTRESSSSAAGWPPVRPHKGRGVSAPSKTPDALDRIAEQLEERGLRPLIDRDMDLVVADCPECRAATPTRSGSGGP
jgi:hypothetical protein